jgi:nicotinamidase-related amidase
MRTERSDFIENSAITLGQIYDSLNSLEAVAIKTLASEETALVVVDLINGFAREGALQSPRIEALIPSIAKLAKACEKWGIVKLAFADAHPSSSPEFESYPPHCLAGTAESQLVEELKVIGHFTQIDKNSTNGFLEPAFKDWLLHHEELNTFIIAGDCTDICIAQFATTLKCHFNRLNRRVRILVPINAVDTFDFGMHNGDLMHAVALTMMQGSGVEVVKEIQLD